MTPTLLLCVCVSVSAQSFSTTFVFSSVKINNKLGSIYSKLLYLHTGFKASLRSTRDSSACSGTDLETLLQALGDSWQVMPSLTNYQAESQPCVLLQGDGGHPVCTVAQPLRTSLSVALIPGAAGSVREGKETFRIGSSPPAFPDAKCELRFQESSHTKQRIPGYCFGPGGAQDKSARTCSLPRPRAPTQPPCAQVSQESPYG